MRNAIVTIAIGDRYEEISAKTRPSMTQYADKIGAELIVITEQRINKTTPHWEKFQLYDILGIYDRVIFFDTDIYICSNCPNLFDIVPYDCIGAMDEHVYTKQKGSYYNTGVIVVSTKHRDLFKDVICEPSIYFEQDYLNSLFKKASMFHLIDTYNMMTCVNSKEAISKAYIVHYAGFDKSLLNLAS
jgi:lipopolysaccharide biosynthesis glycosyltransferase